MENASKALIIAGAILLAIVIISLGLVVVNNTRGVSDNANLSEQEIQTFNAKFTPYAGTINGNKLKQLCQVLISVNKDRDSKITITGKVTNAEDTSAIKNGGTYTVTLNYSTTTGLVENIDVQ